MARRVIAAGLVLGALAVASPGAASAQLAEGAVPDTALVQDTSGTTVSLARHIGRRPVLVEFWATWCTTCQALQPRLEEAHRRYGADVDFVVIAVGVAQTMADVKRHVRQHPSPFTVYFDATGAAVRAFDVVATGVLVMLDARGQVVYTGAGTGQNVDLAVRRGLSSR